jgi:hypothetical protein
MVPSEQYHHCNAVFGKIDGAVRDVLYRAVDVDVGVTDQLSGARRGVVGWLTLPRVFGPEMCGYTQAPLNGR